MIRTRSTTQTVCLSAVIATAATIASQARAQADECVDAASISGTGQFAFDNNGATTSADQPSNCVGAATAVRQDVWFCWTAPETGRATVSTGGGTSLDTVLAVWSSTCSRSSRAGSPASAGAPCP